MKKIIAILCTGTSLSESDINILRYNNIPFIAVSDAYTLAPDAVALVSTDKAWWGYHSPEFNKIKYSVNDYYPGIKKINKSTSINSGCLACYVAVEKFNADVILLFGVDFYGTHFFGPHPEPELKNTKKNRWQVFEQQYNLFKNSNKNIDVYNCNLLSELKCFPKKELVNILIDLNK